MKAAVMERVGTIRVKEVPDPVPGVGEVLIKTSAVGICGTDLSIYSGKRAVAFPHIAGHEVSGTVVEAGPGTSIPLGTRVTIEPNFRCGRCEMCRRGMSNLCPAKKTVGLEIPGCFAELVAVPEQFVWEVPQRLSDVEVVMIEPLTVALHAVHAARPTPGMRVLVQGCGSIGRLLVQALHLYNADISVADVNPRRLRLAVAQGACATYDLSSGDRPPERAFHVVYDCTGVPAAFRDGQRAVRPGGTLVVVGLSPHEGEVDLFGLVRGELTIRGVVACSWEFPEAIHLLDRKLIDVESIVDCRLSLGDIETALKRMLSQEAVKAVVTVH